MPTVDYQPIATSATANVESQSAFLADLAPGGFLANGFPAGSTPSAKVNKVLRQSSMTASAFATFIANQLNANISDDGNVANLINNFIAALVNATASVSPIAPTGAVLDFAGGTVPSGWLECNGQAVSRTSFARLFGVVGTTFGVGDGSTTFNLPNLNGTATMGRNGGVDSRGTPCPVTAVAQIFGEISHTLSTAEMSQHSHTTTDPGHAHGINDPTHAHGVSDPGHTHSYTGSGGNASGQQGGGGGFTVGGPPFGQNTTGNGTGIGLFASATNVGIFNNQTGISTQNNGASAAHNNMQPIIVVTKIIRT